MSANPPFSSDLLKDLNELLTFPFMVNALEAGTIAAVLAAVAGWYMVLRRQSFAGHTLSVMAFPGAAGAALAGMSAALGYYLACFIAAATMAVAGSAGTRSYSDETASVGTIQAAGLACGFLFLSLNHAVLGGPETLLFGTFLGITHGQVIALLIVAVAVLTILAAICRPLLFASVDPELSRSRGVPVRTLDVVFLLLLGLAVAAASQITGALLVFALLVAPPASAQLITMRPLLGLALGIGFAVLVVWLGLGIAYFSSYPVGFYTTTIATAMYVAIRALRRR